MRFTTLTFLFFFIAVYVLFWVVRGRSRLGLLIGASLVFYAAWSPAFALHFFLLVAINHALITLLHRNRSKALLIGILVLDMGNLFLFKYFYLFLRSLLDLTGLGIFEPQQFNGFLEQTFGVDSITLPLAISFYTFQMTAYAVDVYRGQVEKQARFTEFATFILFFPQLVAGPIMRHSDFFYQLEDVRPDENRMLEGGMLLCQGLIKKVVIADNTITAIQLVYNDPGAFDWTSGLVAVFGYTVRVYCDFSGYTDIARGLGKLMGFDLPENFRGPFLSITVREMWQRWHVTLATWLRDYLFIPMGGSRVGFLRTQFNLVVTFTLGGLWHGAAYTYIIWGFSQGAALVIERLGLMVFRFFVPEREGAPPPGRLIMAGLAFIGFVYSYSVFAFGVIFFNARDLPTALDLLSQIAFLESGDISPHNGYLVGMVLVTLGFNYIQRKNWFNPLPGRVRYIITAVLGFLTVLLLATYAPGGNDFIYFQF